MSSLNREKEENLIYEGLNWDEHNLELDCIDGNILKKSWLQFILRIINYSYVILLIPYVKHFGY